MGLRLKRNLTYIMEGLIPAQAGIEELESGKHLQLKVLSRNPLEEDVLGLPSDAKSSSGEEERAQIWMVW